MILFYQFSVDSDRQCTWIWSRVTYYHVRTVEFVGVLWSVDASDPSEILCLNQIFGLVHSKRGISVNEKCTVFGTHRSTRLPYFDLYYLKLTPEEVLTYS